MTIRELENLLLEMRREEGYISPYKVILRCDRFCCVCWCKKLLMIRKEVSYDYKQEHLIAAAKEVCAKENVEVKQADSGAVYFVAKSSFLLSGDGKKVLSPYQQIHQLAEIKTKVENAEKAVQDAQDRLQHFKAEEDKFWNKNN